MTNTNTTTVTSIPRYRALSGTLILATLFVACGGGGGTDDGTPALRAPSLTNIEAQTYTLGVAIANLVFTNGGGSLTGCSVEPDLPAGLTVGRSSNNATCRITGTPTEVGAQTTYTVTAANATGDDDATVAITINPPAPSLTDADAQIYTTGTAIADLVMSNRGGGSLTECSVDPDLPAGLSVGRTPDNSSCRITGMPTESGAQRTYTVTATNATGDDDALVAITVNPTAPSLTDAEAKAYPTGRSVTFAFTNVGGGLLTGCSKVTDLPEGLRVEISSDASTCLLTGIPTVESVATVYTVTATNITGADNASVSITINPPLPSLADEGGRIYLLNESITELVFTNGGGGSLTDCSVDPDLPLGLTIGRTQDNSTCRITGMPTESGTQRTYTVTATNATGDDDALVAITVNSFTLSVADEQTLNFGVGQSVLIPFINNDSNSLTLSECTAIPDLPPGLTVELSSGDVSCEITGVPLALRAQTTYTITATNATGSGDVNFPLTVGNAFIPDSITVATDGTSAVLSWTARTTATSYEVWRAEVGDGEGISRLATGATATTYTDNGLTAGTDYYHLVAECTALGCVDPSNSGPLAIAAVAEDGQNTNLDGATSITTTPIGDKIYALVAADDDNGVQIIDIGNPITPVAVGSLDDADQPDLILTDASDVTITRIGDRIYALVAAEEDDGVQIIDITTPQRVIPASSSP